MNPDTKMTFSKEQLAPFFEETKRKADKIMDYYILGNFCFGLFLALFYSTWPIALVVGGINLITYFLAKRILPSTTLYQYIGSAITALFVAQFIYQMHGMFEMHFFVFIASLVLVAYQNWKLQLPLIVIVVVHHGTFAWLQYTGMKEIYFTQLEYMTLETFLFHGALAQLIVFLSGYWSYDMRKRAKDSAKNVLFQEYQLSKMSRNVSFAEMLIKGNLDAKLEIDEEDELSKSMLNMQEELRKSRKREQDDKFINTGLAEINDILRSNQHDIQSLCEKVVIKVVKYLKANQGGVFIVEGEADNDTHLVLKALYAYERKKFHEKRVEVGQGLVGQAFYEKNKVYLKEVPQNYIHITSGLGKATPTSILVVPLIYNEKVEGIIELASFNEFQDYEQEFLMKVGESIASTIISVKVNEQTNTLLKNTHMQTEQLQAQEEEMRQNMEELEATQEEMHRTEKELKNKLEVSQSNEELLRKELEKVTKNLEV
ncbi:MAG: GAF domain-containing protein [Fulvivirga sp.]